MVLTNVGLVVMKQETDWKIVRWDFVKGIENNDFTRIVGLIPVAGYLILFNDEIARLASFDVLAGVKGDDVSPFLFSGLTKLRLVFLGSLSVLCSFFIYRLFRPAVLEVSKNELEFSELVRQRYSVHELTEMENYVHSERWIERTSSFWTVRGKKRSKEPVVSGYVPEARALMFSKHSDYIGFLAREWWVGTMHTYRLARVSSAVLGTLGYLLLALPTVDVAQAVLRHLSTG